jgi:hypothetical protein
MESEDTEKKTENNIGKPFKQDGNQLIRRKGLY